jgi:hypothetical protein
MHGLPNSAEMKLDDGCGPHELSCWFGPSIAVSKGWITVKIFNSAMRTGPRAAQPSREPQSVAFLINRVQPNGSRSEGGSIVAFTSANPGEGVSHVVQFVAEKLASQSGKPTLIIKAGQLNSLRLSDLIEVHNPGSLARYRLDVGVASANGVHAGHPNGQSAATFHSTGNGNGNGAVHSANEKQALIENQTGLDLLRTVRADLGHTLIDCPALSSSSEAVMLAPDVDGLVLVVEADRTRRDQILHARQTIEMARGNLIGLVLNKRRHVVPAGLYRRL